MDNRVSYRVDAEAARNLHAEARRRKTTMTAVIKEAIRKEWERVSPHLLVPGSARNQSIDAHSYLWYSW
jgi:hypothetical protein